LHTDENDFTVNDLVVSQKVHQRCIKPHVKLQQRSAYITYRYTPVPYLSGSLIKMSEEVASVETHWQTVSDSLLVLQGSVAYKIDVVLNTIHIQYIFC